MENGPVPCAHKLRTKPSGSDQPRRHLRGHHLTESVSRIGAHSRRWAYTTAL